MSSQATASDSYPIHENEGDRLASLQSYEILDISMEQPYDNLTELVADHFDVPIVLLSLMDEERQWFKSTYGFGDSETERECDFCNYTIVREDLFVVSDAQKNERFLDNKLLTGPPYVRYYAGYPLFGEEGLPLGTFCLIDTEPRRLSDDEADNLKYTQDKLKLCLIFT